MRIEQLETFDLRFSLPPGAGSDALHTNPEYSLATCMLVADNGELGTGFSLTLGAGNELVCRAADLYRRYFISADPEDLVADLGANWHKWANDGQLRWLGPQKGVVHLALAALVSALLDLWSRVKGVPLWKALLDLTPEQLVTLVDFTSIENYIRADEALELLETRRLPTEAVEALVHEGYPAYDTSVGWLGYPLGLLLEKVGECRERGYSAVKIKVGSRELMEDVERLAAVRAVLGDDFLMMIDANQRWTPHEAVAAGRLFAEYGPFWFEEPVHPDDLSGYVEVGKALAPMQIAGGEHIPNQVVFKNFFEARALQVAQPDVVRLGGLPEYLAVALMAAKSGIPVIPHVGDMAQIHQHLAVVGRVTLGLPELPLEMIPHLSEHFVEPCTLARGRYVLPSTPGSSTRIQPRSIRRFAVGT